MEKCLILSCRLPNLLMEIARFVYARGYVSDNFLLEHLGKQLLMHNIFEQKGNSNNLEDLMNFVSEKTH